MNSMVIVAVLVAVLAVVIILVLFYMKRRDDQPVEDYGPYPGWDGSGEEMPDLSQHEYRCPQCNEPVDGYSNECHNCGMMFKDMEFACPRCGADVKPGDVECSTCGNLLHPAHTVCPRCGGAVANDATHCDRCHGDFWSPILIPEHELESRIKVPEKVPGTEGADKEDGMPGGDGMPPERDDMP